MTPATLPAPPALLARVLLEQARSSINPLRGCELCDHGAGPAHTCLYGARPVPACVARSDDGHCGPEARHQQINGDDLQARPARQMHLLWSTPDEHQARPART